MAFPELIASITNIKTFKIEAPKLGLEDLERVWHILSEEIRGANANHDREYITLITDKFHFVDNLLKEVRAETVRILESALEGENKLVVWLEN